MELTDLIEVDILQRVQDSFSKFTGLASVTTDANGVPVTQVSSFTDFCMKYTRQSALGNHRCEECDRRGALYTLATGHAQVYSCHAGLMDFSAPIMLNDKMIGCIVGGQARTTEIDEEKVKAVAVELGIDPEEYLEAAQKTYLVSKEYVEKGARHLEELAAILSQVAYQSFESLHKSKEAEERSRLQTNYAIQKMEKMKYNVINWRKVFQELEDKNEPVSSEFRQKMSIEFKDQIAEIQGAEEYINASMGNNKLNEEIYAIRDVLRDIGEDAYAD